MKAEKNKFASRFLYLILAAVLSIPVCAQENSARQLKEQNSKAETITLQLNSKLTAREMPYRIILPVNYKRDKEKRYPVIYLLHGLTGHFDNWTDKTKLAEYAARYNYIIVTPEGNDGWYTDSASAANDKYESYIIRELIPEIDKNFHTIADKNYRFIAGLSMGGYGALKFGLKYPEMFSLAGSFSGALQAASFTDKILGNGWKALTDSITSVYGAEDSLTRKENDIYKIVREMPAEKIKALPFFYFDCGTEDGFFAGNREFAALLLEKKIPHEFRQLPGRHDWRFWEAQVQEFLELSETKLPQAKAKTN